MADYSCNVNDGASFDAAMAKINDLIIIDNLASTDTNNPLSAKQGGILRGMFVNPNLLINGNFQVWQRGTTFTVGTSAWTYAADRFRVKATSGTVTITKDSAGLKASGACTVQYVLSADDLAMLTGKTVTLTYSKNGTVQTSTATITTKVAVSLTLAVNDVVNWVKLELGSYSTGRIIRPFNAELVDCQAYYETLSANNYGYIGNGIVFTGGNPYVIFPCKQKIQNTTFSVVATGTFRLVGYGTASITASDINNIADGATKRLQSNALSLVMTNITFTSWVNTAFVFGGNNTGSIAIDCEDYAN